MRLTDLAADYPELASIMLAGEALPECDVPDDRQRQAAAVAVLILLDELPAGCRIARLLVLRLLLWRARGRLRKTGDTPCDAFCVSPSLDQPIFVYSMRPPSTRYARTNLLSRQTGLKGLAKALVSWVAGCDASTAGIVVVARTA